MRFVCIGLLVLNMSCQSQPSAKKAPEDHAKTTKAEFKAELKAEIKAELRAELIRELRAEPPVEELDNTATTPTEANPAMKLESDRVEPVPIPNGWLG